MRTTILIDNDISFEIERLVYKENRSKKEIINDLLRKGLSRASEKEKKHQVATEPYSLGKCKYPNIDNISEVLATAY